ncbi:MAG TPA: hypothetical protein VD838_09700 [Anaeromyxobacteraceae bacterium]|nr:hypothetical protein [Anaeromyxobacteraceae bacterium]
MTAMREVVYECRYASGAEQRIAHVRAWDLREAVELFAEELASDGVAAGGTISAHAFGSSEKSEAAYPLR